MPVERVCEGCGSQFYCYESEAEKGRKYCSRGCKGRSNGTRPVTADSRAPVEFTCKECGKPFAMMKSYVTAYNKKFGRDPLYCSNTCSALGRRKVADERNKLTCAQCGKVEIRSRSSGKRIYREQQFCSQGCKSESQRTKALAKFESGTYGRHVKRNGYVWISVPVLVNGKKGAIMEHRFVMSRHIGRDLFPEETVHHINGVRSDNRIENLELFNSRHGPGQRVTDKVAFAIEILRQYPEFARRAGYELTVVHEISDSSART